ncbi:MAG: nucleotidyltransferase domain-containing protein [Desulfurococcales archaeon]|nr:nucleotidyltransferase domain-containing protein [Desulfurococcales archaeon]
MSMPYELKLLKYLKNFMSIAKEVKEMVRKIDPEAEVYVFGSVVSGGWTGASDIDILIVTENISRKYDIMVEVYKNTEAPVELHIVTPQQFEKWYRRFISEEELLRI